MSDNQDSAGGLLGALGVGLALCCGLPLLLGAGIALSVAGLVAGSVAVIAAGAAIGIWGWRRHQAGRACDTPSRSTDTADQPARRPADRLAPRSAQPTGRSDQP